MAKKRTKVFSNFSYVDLYPVQYGFEACQPSHSKPRGKFNNYIFHMVADGRGVYNNDTTGERMELAIGEGFLISPGDIASYQADMVEPWTYYWIEFNGIKAKSFMEEAGFRADNSVYQLDNKCILTKYIDLFESMLEEEAEELVIGLTYQVMHLIITESAAFVPSDDDGSDAQNFYIKEAVKYISRHYRENITVEDVAIHCNLSRTYLAKLFKRKVSVTPSKYISQYRLNKSVELLKDPQLSIGEIAENIGYSNQFVFSNAFKKEYGLAPSAWRNRERH